MKRPLILVIDDQAENLQIIVNFLNKIDNDYTIIIATDGKIGSKLAIKELPDLIITDWEMPEMDGIETIKYLKKHDATKNIPNLYIVWSPSSY